MESLFLNLIRILKQYDQTLAELLKTTEEHNLALRHNDVSEVLSTANRQDGLSRELKGQRRKLEETKRQLAGICCLPEKAVLSDFARSAPGPLAAELAELAQSIKEKILRLDEINIINRVLSRRGQIFTSKLVKIIARSGGGTYLGSGRLKNESKPLRIFDATI
ncbi:flagellar protein FlgN [Pelotomaculum propionicicum]|uniref:FlgN protein n=1 Tax=Pelotomaculum propionicicum TaxID=258475 RepID=A0A4Y7RQT2_9FIRM|nr:flagellar protein FlgN [Pelotomaculum propionicicum]NLI13194.1 flagellar protein FlgN [Peptococcaceae bacterium]TEB11176.1 hypothetical protein Pmgp_01872 [Pelotomaculum propionicicum]